MGAGQKVLKWEIAVDDQWHPVGSGEVTGVACPLDSDGLPDPSRVWVWTVETPDDSGTVGWLREARVFGTGQTIRIDSPARHRPVRVLGTAVAGPLVWHVVRV